VTQRDGVPERLWRSKDAQQYFRTYLKQRGVSPAWLAEQTGLPLYTATKIFRHQYQLKRSGFGRKILECLLQAPELTIEQRSNLERLFFLSPRPRQGAQPKRQKCAKESSPQQDALTSSISPPIEL
jgi:hypothetical protein